MRKRKDPDPQHWKAGFDFNVCFIIEELSKTTFSGRDIEPYRISDQSASRINARWTNEELLLAVQGEIFFDHWANQLFR
jgi:hypothetical protein